MTRHLVVDACSTNALCLQRGLLEIDPDAEIHVAPDGETAEQLARSLAPDVMWVELVLPLHLGGSSDPIMSRITPDHRLLPGPNNGMLVARRLRSIAPEATLIVCTRLNLRHPDVRAALQEGADGAIGAPARPQALAEALSAYALLPVVDEAARAGAAHAEAGLAGGALVAHAKAQDHVRAK